MVLAAGLGTRLRPLTDRLPKPLLPILNQPMLTGNLLLLRHAGVREVVVNLHHLGAAIRDTLGDGRGLGIELRYSEESILLGTGGGVRRVLPWLAERGTFLVLNGDTLVDCDLRAALARHRARGAVATLLLHRHPDAAAYGAVGLDGRGRVEAIGDLLGPRPASDLLFAGVHLLEPALLEPLSAEEPSCIIRQAYAPAIRAGLPVYGDPAVSFWADLGTPSRYLAVQRLLLGRPELLPLGLPAPAPLPRLPGLQLHPPAVIGPGLRLEGQAVVGPEVVLGPDVVLADGVRLERCVVWGGARVGTSLADGIYTDDGCWVGVRPARAPG